MTTEQKTEVESLAGLFFNRADVALIAGVQEDDPEFDQAYKRGKLKSEAEVRKSIVGLAKGGSPQAQRDALKLIQRLRL